MIMDSGNKSMVWQLLSGKFKYQLAFKARFFHSTRIDPKWKNVTLVATIGGHKFYY